MVGLGFGYDVALFGLPVGVAALLLADWVGLTDWMIRHAPK